MDLSVIQHWFCILSSVFGSHCADPDQVSGGAFAWIFLNNPVFIFVGVIFTFLWRLYSLLAYTASFLLVVLIIGSLAGLYYLRSREHERYGNLPPALQKQHPLSDRWHVLLESSMSSDPRKWKEGIMGADIMLGELFQKLGYEGENTAERLRKIPDGAFANLTAAWEAHRIKNFVFSISSHFILTQREAFRTMKLYEQVFREFDFI